MIHLSRPSPPLFPGEAFQGFNGDRGLELGEVLVAQRADIAGHLRGLPLAYGEF
ncbi:hypothetical protein GCM10023063_17920 [Arthrobacter methylotrophus]